jgi:hypothetical protein
MVATRSWTQTDSLNMMKTNQQPSPCQGAGHAIVATACLSVLLFRRPLRRPRLTLGITLVLTLVRRPLRPRPTHRYLLVPRCRPAYHALRATGRRAQRLALHLLLTVLKPLMRHVACDHLLLALDDTPTARYGPKVQGAGIHHNPTPGPAGEKFVYGHLWVTLAWLVRHPAWDTLALPLRALLYVRAQDVPKLAKRPPWTFGTKLELAVEQVRWLCVWLSNVGKQLRVVVDGVYAKRPFLRPVRALGVVVFSRLRKDADLRTLPTRKRRRGSRGPLPTYGTGRIDLAKRAGQKRGWRQVRCLQYGQWVVKTIKSFEATWHPVV